jgi:hypothetical protein
VQQPCLAAWLVVFDLHRAFRGTNNSGCAGRSPHRLGVTVVFGLPGDSINGIMEGRVVDTSGKDLSRQYRRS